jgi:site-specific DNA-cytosine methylase
VAEPFRKATTLHSANAGDERWEEAKTTNTLAGHGATTREAIVMAPAFSKRPGQQIATRDDGLSYAVTTGQPPSVLAFQGGAQQDQVLAGGDIVPTLAHSSNHHQGHHQPKYFDGAMVRRLTPTECERLQGFPDGWTDGQPDSTRYRQLGNAVCVNVAEWIGKRIVRTAGLRNDGPERTEG